MVNLFTNSGCLEYLNDSFIVVSELYGHDIVTSGSTKWYFSVLISRLRIFCSHPLINVGDQGPKASNDY
jgi:hypothetical protein